MTIQPEVFPKPRLRPISVLILILIGIPLVFFMGYAVGGTRTGLVLDELEHQTIELSTARQQLSRTGLQRDLSRLEGKLGLAMYEANRNNFANAAADATQFFDGLRAALTNPALTGVANRAELESILGTRDTVTSGLARADAGVKQQLADLYVRFGGQSSGAALGR